MRRQDNQWDVLVEASGEESEWVSVKEARGPVSCCSVNEAMTEDIESAVRMEGMDWVDE